MDRSTIEVAGDLLGSKGILLVASARIVHFRFCIVSCRIGAHTSVHELGRVEDLCVYDLLTKILFELLSLQCVVHVLRRHSWLWQLESLRLPLERAGVVPLASGKTLLVYLFGNLPS